MDSSLYTAAREGNIDVLIQNKDQLDVQVTPNNNTALHVAALFGNTQSVIEILNMCPSIRCHVNMKGETALHIAGREGHSDIARALIEYGKALGEELENGVGTAKEMLRMTNEAKDTALHEAVRNHRPDVAVLLIQEDPEFSHPANNDEETPLYLAAERGYVGLVSEILKTCRTPADGGPYGRTALVNKDERKTPLHIAASRGHTDTMKELISHCPDCWEMVDGKGQNILHIALHLLAASDCYEPNLIMHPRSDKMAVNKENMTPLITTS